MKFVVSISAVLILFLQSVNVSVADVLKIPDLIEHYRVHQKEKGDSLLSFISKHYGTERAAHQSEDTDHDDLPFHHTLQGVDIQLSPSLNIDVTPSIEEGIYHCFLYVSSASRLGEHKINHPPQAFC